MINPIQQNVAFRGVEKTNSTDKFTGNMPVSQSVRGDYASTVNSVLSVQQSMREKTDSVSAGKLNVIA